MIVANFTNALRGRHICLNAQKVHCIMMKAKYATGQRMLIAVTTLIQPPMIKQTSARVKAMDSTLTHQTAPNTTIVAAETLSSLRVLLVSTGVQKSATAIGSLMSIVEIAHTRPLQAALVTYVRMEIRNYIQTHQVFITLYVVYMVSRIMTPAEIISNSILSLACVTGQKMLTASLPYEEEIN